MGTLSRRPARTGGVNCGSFVAAVAGRVVCTVFAKLERTAVRLSWPSWVILLQLLLDYVLLKSTFIP